MTVSVILAAAQMGMKPTNSHVARTLFTTGIGPDEASVSTKVAAATIADALRSRVRSQPADAPEAMANATDPRVPGQSPARTPASRSVFENAVAGASVANMTRPNAVPS
jgi:hypothetical protein